jgi:hypothetical protein
LPTSPLELFAISSCVAFRDSDQYAVRATLGAFEGAYKKFKLGIAAVAHVLKTANYNNFSILVLHLEWQHGIASIHLFVHGLVVFHEKAVPTGAPKKGRNMQNFCCTSQERL